MTSFKFPLSTTAAKRWPDRQRLGVRLSIILGVMVLSACVAYKLPEAYMRLFLLLPFLVAGGLVLLRWPPLGLLLIVAASMVGTIHIPAIGLTAALVSVLGVLWLVGIVVQKQAISLISSPVMLPLAFFSVVSILAFGVGQFPWYPIAPAPLEAQLAGLGIFILSFLALALAAYQLKSIRWLKAMTFLFIGLGAIAVLPVLLPGIGRFVQTIFSRRVLGGSMFWTWLVAIVLSQVLFNRKLSRRWQVLLALLLIIVIYDRLVLARAWSSGWVPPVTAALVIVLLRWPRVTVPSFLVGGLVFITRFQQFYDTFIRIGDNEYSLVTRLEAWRIVGEIIRVNPILGLGPANYRFYTPLYPILGWYVQFNSHNNYVDIVAQVGLLGLFCLLWFFWAIGRLGWRLRNQVPRGGFAQAYVYGCLGGLAGTIVAGMLGDWVLPFVYNVGIDGMRASVLGWLFMGGLAALPRLVLPKKTAVF